MIDSVKEVSSPSGKRVDKISQRARKVRVRVRYGHRRIQRISRTATLGGIFLSFLKVGLVGFGGGLAVIAHIRTLSVHKRHWLNEFEFAEGFALAQSLPGTAAGNVATFVGLKLRGWRGAAVAIVGFILPSMLMMIVLAILYRHLRYLPNTDLLFHGFNAAVVALIVVTAYRMGRNTLQHRWQWIVGVLACLAVVAIGATVIEVVLAAGLIGVLIDSFAEKRFQVWKRVRTASSRRRKRIVSRLTEGRRQRGSGSKKSSFVREYLLRTPTPEPTRQNLEKNESDPEDASKKVMHSIAPLGLAMPVMLKLGLLLAVASVFLRIGSITFGGGFVMIPLIETEAVDTHHWLTHQEFADATALGQITPGPVLITATFIGYRVAGTVGALIATVCIFLPSFLMTIAAGSSLRRFRDNQIVQSFLQGVTPAVSGLLVAAAISMGRAGIHTFIGLGLALAAGFVLVRFRPNPFWVIMGSGLLRFLFGMISL
ncbi:MAG TPA: chromate transporter [Pyrinomonadaceae bacterium]|nr:chromate transporter [Pyrinomonadaceae bacterium]